ncbi:hypothetical protein N5K27_22500 [Pigmentiphaga sp. GD03639]|uniref:hypothetical protein n=1 Tax=Pigmentiphaga sp. GD03639 TaxID=2975354 RepID=UPI00244ADD49|nr:hypothetical protein [Pigmentiphaga sp. GD03639]MDH2239083.1 hypothetical protein [Pigmentiphaga sp. GD03639]
MSNALIDQAPAYDHLGKITFMVRSGGYVMCRRPRCMPFILSEKEWRRLPKTEEEGASVCIGGWTR